MNLRDSAYEYYNQYGWVCIPLRVDPSSGIAKIPITPEWQRTPADWSVIESLEWEKAEGIGIVLGPVSDNLAVIDVDSEALTDAMLSALDGRKDYYAVRTGRRRSHWYFREGTPTSPQTFPAAQWHGETLSIELKTQGQQVAAPPTPGYSFCGTSKVPTPVATLGAAWGPISHTMNVTGTDRTTGKKGGGFPSAWQNEVVEGSRNNSLFVESCRLAEAGMPLDSAMKTMAARMDVSYKGDLDPHEIERTVRSAYRRVKRPPIIRGGIQI